MVWVHPRELAKQAKAKKRPPIFPAKVKFKHWEECIQAFFAQLNPIAKTRISYEQYLRAFFARDPSRTPNDYHKRDVERWLAEPTVQGKQASNSLYNCKLNALASFYAYAASYEYEFRGTMRIILVRQPPTNKISHRKDIFHSRAMTDTEMRRFFAAIESSSASPTIKKRDRALFLMYFWTARRCREISDLLWGDIERRTIYQHGENSEHWFYSWRGKGRRSKDDTAELPIWAVEALIEYLQESGRWDHLTAEEPLFPGMYGQTLHPHTIAGRCLAYMRAAGLSGSGTHRFRHTRALVTYEETNNDIVAVSKLLRHSSIDMTRRYVQSAQGQIDATVPKLRLRFGDM